MITNPTIHKIARLITTLKCKRDCGDEYCEMIPIQQEDIIQKMTEYDLVFIKGGEPILDLDFHFILHLISKLKIEKPNLLIYMYLSTFILGVSYLLEYLDGMHYTIHDENKIDDFLNIQEMFRKYEDKSFKLSLSHNINSRISIIPSVWKEIRFKKWFDSEECIVPVHEDLYVIKSKLIFPQLKTI